MLRHLLDDLFTLRFCVLSESDEHRLLRARLINRSNSISEELEVRFELLELADDCLRGRLLGHSGGAATSGFSLVASATERP